MTEERCERCDRPHATKEPAVRYLGNQRIFPDAGLCYARVCFDGNSDCLAHRVDWRDRCQRATAYVALLEFGASDPILSALLAILRGEETKP